MAVYRQTGQMPQALLDAPALDPALEYLWGYFNDLHGSRGATGFGPARIAFSDIDAWGRVSGITLTSWELEAIRRADNAYLADYAARSKEARH